MISQAFIRELIDRADIYEVVNRRVPLQTKGINAWACCPFHHEKTPSFSVNREKQMFHCFGCGEHGNAIGFIMKYENLPFPDAVERLAQECGVKVVYDERGKRSPNPEKIRLTDLMQQAQEYYQARLQESQTALDYIRQRALTPETVKRFGIGFSPDGWRNLDTVFGKDKFDQLITVGLKKKNDSGNIYDFFRNRLMFPIKNVRGQVIAFSARTMTGEEPKYINTGDTPLFTKGNEIFGLYEARKAIQEKKRVIVVEGQIDVIQLSQAGLAEACAPLGTAIRSEHIERLTKMTDNLIFSFDGDAAGRKAALRAMDLSLPLLGEKQKAVFLFLPEGEDPDSLIKGKGAEAFEELISKALPLSSYLIESQSKGLDLTVIEDKSIFIEAVSPYIKKTKNPILRNGLIERVATAVGYKDSEKLSSYFGFPIPKPTVNRPAYGYGQRRNFGERVAASPSFTQTSRRSLPPKAEAPMLVLLRNFLRFPQLAVEFESAALELLNSLQSGPKEKIFRVIRTVTEEDLSGNSIASSLELLPGYTDSQFEKEMASLRSLLFTMLLSEGQDEDIDNASRRGELLGTPLQLARLETRRIFLQLELDANELDRKNLCSKNELSTEDRERYQSMVAVGKRIKNEIRMIDEKINDSLTRAN